MVAHAYTSNIATDVENCIHLYSMQLLVLYMHTVQLAGIRDFRSSSSSFGSPVLATSVELVQSFLL